MRFRNTLISTLAFALLLSAPAAFAADFNIGVVDVEYVILNSKKGKAAKKKLKRTFDKRQKELDVLQKDLLAKKKTLETASEMMPPEKRKQLMMEYQAGLAGLQERFVKNQKELASKEMALMKPILKRLEEALTAVAKAKNLDIIMNRSQQGVIFAKPSFDITKDVLSKLDG